MKIYQMPCLRKAASQNRHNTFLTMKIGRTQGFWTVGTVQGMLIFIETCIYLHMFLSFVTCNYWPVISYSTSLCFSVAKACSKVSWVMQPNPKKLLSDELWSDTDHLDLSVAEILGGKTISLFALCFSFHFLVLYQTNAENHTYCIPSLCFASFQSA